MQFPFCSKNAERGVREFSDATTGRFGAPRILADGIQCSQSGNFGARSSRFFAALWLFCLTFAMPAMVIGSPTLPESGVYWNPHQIGNGYFFEVQGGTFSFSILAYDLQGGAELYVASGSVSEGLQAPLFRHSGGAQLGDLRENPVGAGLLAERVGMVRLYNHLEGADTYRSLFVDVVLDAPPRPEWASTTLSLIRMNFGRGGIGSRFGQSCWPDLRGEWVFIDKGDARAAASRFHFTALTVSSSTEVSCVRSGDEHSLTFRDPVAGADLRCVKLFGGPDPLDGRLKYSGCELRRDGNSEVLFSVAEDDLGLERMIGSQGPLAVIGGGTPIRSTGAILGIRTD